MLAARVVSFGRPLKITEVPEPEVGPRELLVKVMAAGICGTDLHA